MMMKTVDTFPRF